MKLTDTAANPLAFDEIRKRSRRPWGGSLKNYRCFCCGSGMNLANHHIAPRAEGGSDSHRNKVTLCSTCHNAVEGMSWAGIVARREAIRSERRTGAASEETHTERCPTYVSAEDKERFNLARQLRELNSAGTLEEYFSLRQAPAPNSPTGVLMLAVLGKFPGITFEQARAKANVLLDLAAGKRVYRVPPVLTDEEQEARRLAVRARFAALNGSGTSPRTPVNRISSVRGLKKSSGKGLGTWISAPIGGVRV